MDVSKTQQKEKNTNYLTEQLITALDEAVLTFDGAYQIKFCNKALEDLTGLTAAFLYKQTLFTLFGDLKESEVKNKAIYHTELWLNAHTKVFLKVIHQTRDEVEGGVAIVKEIAEFSKGTPAVMHMYKQQEMKEEFETINEQLFSQIQERKKAEDKLRESQLFIEQIADLAPSLIAVYNIQSGKYIFINQAIKEMLGYTPEQVLTEGVNFLTSIIHPEDLTRVLEENQKALDEANIPENISRNAIVSFEYRMRHSNGQWRWFYTYGTIFSRSADNKVEHVLNITVDITEQKATEKELKNKNQLINNILANFPLIISRIDRQGNYLECSGSGLRAIGIADNQLVGANTFEICPHTTHHIQGVLQGGKTSFLDEFEHQGEKKCFQNYYFYDAENACAVGFSIDITDQREAEEKLQESRLFIGQIAETMPDVLYVYDIIEQRNIYVNKEVLQVLGYSPDELKEIGAEINTKILHPDDFAKRHKNTQVLSVLPDGEVHEWEYRMKHKSGGYRWFCSREMIFKRTPEGKPVQVLGIAQDITERKQAADKLQEREHFIKQVADATPDVLYVYDLFQKRSVYINREIWAKLGYTPEEFYALGDKVIETITHPDDLSRRLSHFKNFANVKDGEIVELEYRVKDVRGNWLWIRTRDSVFKRTPEGIPYQILGVTQDITDRKLAEEKLLESQHFIQQIADATPDILYVFDLIKSKAIYVNREISEILGYTQEQIYEMGEHAVQLLFHPEDVRKRLEQLQAFASAKDDEISEVEYRVKDARGNWRWIVTRDAVFKRDPSGNPVQIIGISRDITERKQVEEELKSKNQIIEGILSNLPVMVSRIDRQGVIQEAVGSGLRRIGRKDNEIKGVNIFEAYPQVAHFVDKAIHGDSVSFIGMPEYDGETKYFLNHYFYDAVKESAIGFSIDITEQKEIEKKLIESEAKLKQLNEELESRVQERTAALAISEERFKLVAKVTHDVIWDWDLYTDELSYSEGYNEMFGYSADEILNNIQEWQRCIHPEDAERVIKSIQDVIESGGQEWRDEYRHKRKDESYAWVFDRGYIQHNEEGKPVRMVGAMADISKRKQSEEKLQASEAKFRRMFDSDVIGIIFWNLNGQITDANNAFLIMLGYTREDLLQRKINWRELTPVEYAAGDQKALNELAKDSVHAPVKKVYMHKKGYQVPVLVGGAFLEGYTDRGVSYILDMTDLENALKELALSEERFQLVAKATNDAIRDWNLAADIIWWNEGYRNLFGYTVADIEFGPESWYSRIHPDELEKVLQSLREAVEQGKEQWSGEYRFRRSDGSYAYILDRGYILHNKKGKPIRMLSSMLDITYLKETQEALEQQTIELKQSNADLEQFAFISSHDLQEPLNTASSFAKLLEKKYKNQLDEDAREFINFIVVSTGRMKILVQSLLNYSKINSANKVAAPTDLSKVLHQVKENLKPVIDQTGAIIINEPLPVLSANEAHMIQLFQHLIGNAIKFRSEWQVEIKISVRSQPKHFLFSVSDTGIGIEMKYAERIFQVFQRLHSRDEYEGAGIGLATCKRIVEKHGGTIWVESELGKGSTFYFTIKK